MSGLSLTPPLKERLAHYADEVTLMFDGDGAGQEALEKVGTTFCRRARVYVGVLPEEKDPDDLSEEELLRVYEHRQIFHAVNSW